MNFDGIFTHVITPLAADGSIDKTAFAEAIEFLINARVHGIIVGGSTGEYYAHTMEERLDLIKWSKEVIGNRIPLVIGTGAIRTEDSIEYAKMAKKVGADAILVGSAPYALPTEEENAAHALSIDKAAGLPIMLYNYPGRMSVTMQKTFFDIVTTQSKNFVAIKESTGSTQQLHMLATKYPQIQLSCGWDDQALEFFAWGARSWVCAGSNFIPKEHIALYEAAVLEKNFDKARRIMSAMMPLMDFLEEGKFVQSIKYGCELAGLRAGGLRAPLQPLSDEQKERLTRIIKTLKAEVAAA